MTDKIILWLSAILLAMCLSACTPFYYQVCKLGTEQPLAQSEDKPFTCENEDLVVTYDFWSRGGQISMQMSNVSDKSIYVYLPECFTVINGIAYDYYVDADRSYTKGRFGSVSASANIAFRLYFPYKKPYTAQLGITEGRSVSAKAGTTSSSTVFIHAAKTICIPSHSSKNISFPYGLNDNIYVDCNFDNFPKKTSKPITFDQESSPLNIENKLAYGYTAEAKDIKRIDNKFWLASITNYKEKYFFYTQKFVDCIHKGVWGSKKKRKESIVKEAVSAQSFYNQYSKKLYLLKEIKNTKKKGIIRFSVR